MSWDDARVNYLDELSARKEFSAAELSRRLSAKFKCVITRNAVIAKLRSLGWNNRLPGYKTGTNGTRRTAPRSKTTAAKPEPKPPKPAKNPELKPASRRVGTTAREAVDALNRSDCRWPEGDPLSGNFSFCRRMRRPGFPYCDHHLARSIRRQSVGGVQ